MGQSGQLLFVKGSASQTRSNKQTTAATVTFINHLMHSIMTSADVKIYDIQKSKTHTLKILQHVSDHIGSIIRE